MVTAPNLDPRELMNLRIILMMYRQGWIDACQHLTAETRRIKREMENKYQNLLPENIDSSTPGRSGQHSSYGESSSP